MHGRKPGRSRVRHGSLVRADLICPDHECGGYLRYEGRSKLTQGMGVDGGPIPLVRYYRCEECGKPNKQQVIYRRIERRRDRNIKSPRRRLDESNT